jgi:hypothetical protein
MMWSTRRLFSLALMPCGSRSWADVMIASRTVAVDMRMSRCHTTADAARNSLATTGAPLT